MDVASVDVSVTLVAAVSETALAAVVTTLSVAVMDRSPADATCTYPPPAVVP